MIAWLPRLLRDERGTVVIETAFVVPLLLVMAVGAFEGGKIISRQFELQYAADEAAQVALAAPPHSADQRETLKNVIVASTDLAPANVTVVPKFRCGTDASYVDSETECPDNYYQFVQIALTDTYTPQWTKIAFGSAVNFNVTRTVLIG